jgi:hypothetical protein
MQGESMSYWALMDRVHNSNELLLGYIELVKSTDRELDVVINPPVGAPPLSSPYVRSAIHLPPGPYQQFIVILCKLCKILICLFQFCHSFCNQKNPYFQLITMYAFFNKFISKLSALPALFRLQADTRRQKIPWSNRQLKLVSSPLSLFSHVRSPAMLVLLTTNSEFSPAPYIHFRFRIVKQEMQKTYFVIILK